MNSPFVNGPQACRACFPDDRSNELRFGDWRIVNNPGYYGSAAPSLLILGFSKGANQNRVAERGQFDSIAFANCRQRLESILRVLGLMPANRSIDALMTAAEPEVGVCSLVRCSLAMWKSGEWKTSGDVIPKAFRNPDTAAIVDRCAERHITRLPSSIRRVLFLGTADRYVTNTTALVRRLHPDLRSINEMAFSAAGVIWVYATLEAGQRIVIPCQAQTNRMPFSL